MTATILINSKYPASLQPSFIIGASLALWVQPGHYIDMPAASMHSEATSTLEVSSEALPAGQSLPERIVAIIPTSPTDVILNRSVFQIVVLAIFLAAALVSRGSSSHLAPR